MDVTPPFIVSAPPECSFHRTAAEAFAAVRGSSADVYDAHGMRLSPNADGFEVTSVETAELMHLLRRWLAHADALRESTATWPLWLLVHAAVEHVGYASPTRNMTTPPG